MGDTSALKKIYDHNKSSSSKPKPPLIARGTSEPKDLGGGDASLPDGGLNPTLKKSKQQSLNALASNKSGLM